ncbi:hypothetical protein [Nocardioides sp. SYSU D00038]|uniref:hypothetical protein n=1 Tax=Nocardioides sp. SYSU D00038 TaxID=2812554 RepID=UPI0019678026|nr:hypothetical protein [Nocardioides sp. SYSU D00038]
MTPPTPETRAQAADLADQYEQMLRLADSFDATGDELRARAGLGAEILRDPAVAESADLSRATHTQVEDDVRAATTGKHGLLTRSVELDADALVVRATVLTYQWIDDLRSVATETLGAIAGRAVGYLAPSVALGGTLVQAGLIETDALDRDSVAAYLNELAEAHPELLEHVASGGGLLDGLQMRSLLTSAALAGDDGRAAARGGLRAIGVAPVPAGVSGALRDVAGALLDEPGEVVPTGEGPLDARPGSVQDLMAALHRTRGSVSVQPAAPGRWIAYLPGPGAGEGRRLRLVGADTAGYTAHAVRAIEKAVGDGHGARVMLVGSAAGGVSAAEIAAAGGSAAFTVDQVVTAGAPSAHVPRVPETTHVLALEDRADPVALLGSLVNAGLSNRLTVVFDADAASSDESVYVVGGRAADRADHPDVRAVVDRLHDLGYLAG